MNSDYKQNEDFSGSKKKKVLFNTLNLTNIKINDFLLYNVKY